MRGDVGIGLLLAALAPSSHAGHPLLTEDSATQGASAQQLEFNTDRIGADGANQRVGAFTYTYGVRNELDIFANVPFTFSRPDGLNDISLGVKWLLHDDGTVGIALKPELRIPSGDDSKGLGNGRTGTTLTLIGSYKAAPWTLHGNLAITYSRHRPADSREARRELVWRASIAAWHAFHARWRWVADSGIERGASQTERAYIRYALAGLIYSPARDIDLDAGIKLGLRCGDCAEPIERQVGAGLTWRF